MTDTTIVYDQKSHNKAWLALATVNFFDLTGGKYVTGEDIRFALQEKGLVEPLHSNLWGIFVRELLQNGYLKPTGGYVAMTDPRSHGRKTPIYVKELNV